MRKSHELLLRFRYDPGYDFSHVRVRYLDRGAPEDASWAEGGRIRSLDAYTMEIVSGTGIKCIPYHRIRKILYEGEVVWER
jgi:uncharacterized protein (UPF0248 family)